MTFDYKECRLLDFLCNQSTGTPGGLFDLPTHWDHIEILLYCKTRNFGVVKLLMKPDLKNSG